MLDLSPESHGNATGIGLADLTTTRALKAIDPVPFRMNTLTACSMWRSKLPIDLPTDREVIETSVQTCWNPVAEAVKFCVIPNTLELDELWVSAALLAEVKANPHLEAVGEPVALPLDRSGMLNQEKLFPHSIRGRRGRVANA